MRPTRSFALLLPVLLAALLVACGDAGSDPDALTAVDPETGEPVATPHTDDPGKRVADTDVDVDPEDSCGAAAVDLDPELAAGESEYADETVTFAVKFGDEVSPHRLMSTMLMPGETLDVEVVLGDPNHRYQATAEAGRLEEVGPSSWRWTAPEVPGMTCILVSDLDADEKSCLNVFVLTPYDHSGTLNGYRIGTYQKELYKGRIEYARPEGFVEVREDNLDTWVTPHFQLKQFVCKQASGYPKYLLLRTRMLLKLERILEEVNDQGIPASSFYVMSGYRTPFYNASIGNQTTYSRHAYGDAADIFVDQNRDGRADDIDGDGRATITDARLMQRLVEGLVDETWYHPFVGGLGLYPATAAHPPFIHVDTRGFRARW